MTFDTAQLPTPSTVEPGDVTATYQSGGWRQGGLLLRRVPDPDLDVQAWVLTYQDKPGAVLAVIREHWEAFGTEDFDWLPPGGSEVLRVMHREPPAIDWANPASGTARVFLEEALAH